MEGCDAHGCRYKPCMSQYSMLWCTTPWCAACSNVHTAQNAAAANYHRVCRTGTACLFSMLHNPYQITLTTTKWAVVALPPRRHSYLPLHKIRQLVDGVAGGKPASLLLLITLPLCTLCYCIVGFDVLLSRGWAARNVRFPDQLVAQSFQRYPFSQYSLRFH